MKRDEYEREIIDNIRKYRQARGLTQEELGRRCNMPTGYIGGIETYKRFPKVKNLKRIAEGLEIDIAYLMSPELAKKALEVHDIANDLHKHIQEYVDNYTKPEEELS
ncbi:MAG: helix-turn-helix transcriptional regulator [Sphaerochaetaceae bacterium]|jgi:transcriptional regulator with XRE-family HTH domain|nr:helix-turn-helix transcriptional regulator [Sphaerochaetaceae bacterium]MDY0371118.1 helix-turn-helix transcriptional regulator [Sphaerochaetaceae bacterium]